MGRPSKLTPEVAETIIAAVRAGATYEAAAAEAGIDPRLSRRWLQWGEEERYAREMANLDPDDDANYAPEKLRFVRFLSGLEEARGLRDAELQQRAHLAAVEGSVRLIEEDSNGKLTRRVERTQDGRLALTMLDRGERQRRPATFAESDYGRDPRFASEMMIRYVRDIAERYPESIPTTALKAEHRDRLERAFWSITRDFNAGRPPFDAEPPEPPETTWGDAPDPTEPDIRPNASYNPRTMEEQPYEFDPETGEEWPRWPDDPDSPDRVVGPLDRPELYVPRDHPDYNGPLPLPPGDAA